MNLNQLKNGIKIKWIKNTMNKQLDCEGIDVGDTKGKITHTVKNIKVGIDAFNDLAKSHDAHVKEVERLQKKVDELNNLKLVDQKGELLLECRIGDKNHQLLLEVGLNTILERFVKEGNLGSLKQLDCEGIDISAEKGKVNIVDIPGFEDTVDEVNSIK